MTQPLTAPNDIHQIADDELLAQLQRLVRADYALTARLLVHMGEVDARGLYRERACPSMFEYCVEELHMSESEAYLRIQAARLGRRFPLVVELLGRGALHLTAIKLLGPQLTTDNHFDLLERARGKSKRGIEQLLAEIAPRPDVPTRMRKLPEPPASRSSTTSVEAVSAPQFTPANEKMQPDTSQTPFNLQAPRPRASTQPLSPGRYKLELTAGQALHDKLQQLQDLLRHQVPDGDLAVLVERAVDMLIDNTMRQRFAHTRAVKKAKPRRSTRRTRSRYIPRAVVRAVHQRDSGQCTFVSTDGKRCLERGFLELHHHVPYAKGGESSVENLRLVCRAHNALFAERDYGAELMRSKRQQPREELAPERVECG
jgi:5-methylcytosine-specific restriction endonuclease McrA